MGVDEFEKRHNRLYEALAKGEAERAEIARLVTDILASAKQVEDIDDRDRLRYFIRFWASQLATMGHPYEDVDFDRADRRPTRLTSRSETLNADEGSESAAAVYPEFSDWLRQQPQQWILLTLAFLVGALDVASTWLIAHRALSDLATKVLSVAPTTLHVVVLMYIVSVVFRRSSESDSFDLRATLAARQLQQAWRLLWLTWLVFYNCMLAKAAIDAWSPGSAVLSLWSGVVLNTLNNIQTACFVAAYLVLAKSTVVEREQADRGSYLPWATIMSVVLVVLTAQVVFAAVLPDVMWLQKFFKGMSGIAAGVGLALFVGKLGNKFVSLPSGVHAALFVYAVIQPSFVVFGDKEKQLLEHVVVFAALPLKILLFVCVHWLLTTGRALFYFREIRELQARVDRALKRPVQSSAQARAPGAAVSSTKPSMRS